VLLAYAQGGFVTLASLGDSRAYLLTDDGPAIVTGDHNVRGEKLRMKIIYEGTSSGNALMRYLGYFNEHYEIALPKPDLRTFHMLPKERLLLCSDGYTDYAAHGHNDLCMLMRDAIENTPLPLACNNLILQANLGGGGDNITVLLAECTKKYIAASGE
jgi:protein phosphatase